MIIKAPPIPPKLQEKAEHQAKVFLGKLGRMRWDDLSPHISPEFEVTVVVKISYNATGHLQRPRIHFYNEIEHAGEQIHFIYLKYEPEKLLVSAIKSKWLSDYIARTYAPHRPFIAVDDEELMYIIADNFVDLSIAECFVDDYAMKRYITADLAWSEQEIRKTESQHDRLIRKAASDE